MGRRPWAYQCHAPSRGGQDEQCHANDAPHPTTKRRTRDEDEDGEAGREQPGVIVGGVMQATLAVLTSALRSCRRRVRGVRQARRTMVGGNHQAQRDHNKPPHSPDG
jgi:hypothetical protein